MKQYTALQIAERFKQLGYIWPKGIHLVGTRSKADEYNKFDDYFYILDCTTPIVKVTISSCTTNPGGSWLKEKMNPKGCAVLKPGQYIDTWILGKHKGVYEALVQAKPVPVYRDKNKDNKSDQSGSLDIGMFGINIHRANEKLISQLIDLWSAGCQVLNEPMKYAKLISTVHEANQRGQKFFTYTLLQEW